MCKRQANAEHRDHSNSPCTNHAAGNRHNDRFSTAINCSLSLIWQKCSTVQVRSEVFYCFLPTGCTLTSQQNNHWQQGPHIGMTFCCKKNVIWNINFQLKTSTEGISSPQRYTVAWVKHTKSIVTFYSIYLPPPLPAARRQMRPVVLNSQEAGAPEPVLPGCPWKLKRSVPHTAAQQEQGSLTGPLHLWAREGTAQQKECWQRPQQRKVQRSSPRGIAVSAEMGSPITEMRESSQWMSELIRQQDSNKKKYQFQGHIPNFCTCSSTPKILPKMWSKLLMQAACKSPCLNKQIPTHSPKS